MMKSLDKKYILVFVIVVIFEIFICNYKSIKSHVLNYEEIEYNQFSEENLKDVNGDGKQIEIEIGNINTKIYNIYVDYENLYDKFPTETIVDINYTDQLFSGYYQDCGSDRIMRHRMLQEYDKSKYISCDFIGESEKILLTLKNGLGIKINSIKINKKIPFEFNWLRVILLTLFISGVYSLLNKEFFKRGFDINNKDQKSVLSLISMIFIVILVLMQQAISMNTEITQQVKINELYGQAFVESIINGHMDINQYDTELLNIIKNEDKPYDYNTYKEKGIDESNSYFDSAYFNGNTYMYYGILPALILLVPIKLLTGRFMYIEFGTFLFFAISSIFTVKLFAEVIYRYFKNTPFYLVILLCTFALFNNKILWVMSRPWTYEFVISAGYCFVMIGMYEFFKYLRLNRMPYLFLACLFMALSVACRPTCLFASLFIIIKISYDLVKNIQNKTVNVNYMIKLIICLLPYVIVGVSLMAYNYIRFGNIFEFGANYQISVTDFRYFGFNINRVIIGIITFLCSPIKFCLDFPFVFSENFMPEYMGFYYSQPIGGGYLTTSIIGIIILFIPWLWKKIKEHNKEMRFIIAGSIVISFCLIILETNKCGSLGRYMMDFAWMINIAVVLLILLLYSNIKEGNNKILFIKVLMLLIVISCVINTLLIFSNEGHLLKKGHNLTRYYYLKYLFSFWM